jgi:hypothetical protein
MVFKTNKQIGYYMYIYNFHTSWVIIIIINIIIIISLNCIYAPICRYNLLLLLCHHYLCYNSDLYNIIIIIIIFLSLPN